MSSISGIKSRIGTIQSIRKITHAMELVSFSKLKRAKLEYEEVLKYDVLIDEIFTKIFQNLYEDELHDLIQPKSNTKTDLYIVVSSNLGLAGGYNANIIKLTKQTVSQDDKLIILGSYGLRGLQHLYKDRIINTINQDPKISIHKIVKKIVKLAMQLYANNEIRSIKVIYSKYINNLVQTDVCEQIYPFNEEVIRPLIASKEYDHKLEFEPSPKKILAEAVPLYVDSKLYSAIACAKISEIASRRIAMENATDNADQLIDNLNIEYNRKRQSKITQEIIEIVSGADAVQ
ncbi:ATP synthase F1 subunit gamma [Mycoplasmopsis felifaucium]|uniref:ATP synthase gamma chain n=1 Tax=Mycoplasmopsis felifaucium TaxID=35768 RepID=A0ABZ2RS52_9BACT